MFFFYKPDTPEATFQKKELVNGVAEVNIEPNIDYRLALRTSGIYNDADIRGKDDDLWLAPDMRTMVDRDWVITSPAAPQQWGILWNKYPNRVSYSSWGKIKNAIVANQLAGKEINYDRSAAWGITSTTPPQLKHLLRFEDGKLAFIPFSNTNPGITVLDLVTGTIDNYYALLKGDPLYLENEIFGGGVLTHNGHIVCIPYTQQFPLEASVETEAMGEYPFVHYPSIDDPNQYYLPNYDATPAKYSGGVLMQDGRIYCVPYNSPQAAIIDPAAQTITKFGDIDNTTGKYSNGVLLEDGRVLLVPYNAHYVMIYDPVTNTHTKDMTQEFSSLGSFSKGVLLIDGRVLLVPYDDVHIAIFDPSPDGFTWDYPWGSFPTTYLHKFSSGVLLPDGRVMLIPFDYSATYIVNPIDGSLTSFAFDSTLGKYSSGLLLTDGRVLACPWNALSSRIYYASDNDYGVLPDADSFLSGYINR